jgi:2-polyprenyl-3-methyl-5-hydroxy-6-metoxy-1,4-benzoquinol methylase
MIHKVFANNSDPDSVASKMRQNRFRLFQEIIKDIPKPVTVLDIGGTQGYWEMRGANANSEIQVTLLNLSAPRVSLPNFTSTAGDGRSLHQFADQQFDIVFSNSTIEHVGTFEDQKQMASEVRRLGKRYYLQTPNLYFPIEPHFVFPLFQFLPVSLRVWLLQHFKLGWISKTPDYDEAMLQVTSIRLMKKKELIRLFPEATIYEEKFLGLVKSFVAYKAN